MNPECRDGETEHFLYLGWVALGPGDHPGTSDAYDQPDTRGLRVASSTDWLAASTRPELSGSKTSLMIANRTPRGS